MKTNRNLKNRIFAAIAASSIVLSSYSTVLSTNAGRFNWFGFSKVNDNANNVNGNANATEEQKEKKEEESKPKKPTAKMDGRVLKITAGDAEITISRKGQQRMAKQGIKKMAATPKVNFAPVTEEDKVEYGWTESDWRNFVQRYTMLNGSKFLPRAIHKVCPAINVYNLYGSNYVPAEGELNVRDNFNYNSILNDSEPSEMEEELQNESNNEDEKKSEIKETKEQQ